MITATAPEFKYGKLLAPDAPCRSHPHIDVFVKMVMLLKDILVLCPQNRHALRDDTNSPILTCLEAGRLTGLRCIQDRVGLKTAQPEARGIMSP